LINDAVIVFKAAADGTRIRLLNLFFNSPAAIIGANQLVQALKKPQYTTWRHLATLMKAGIISDKRRGLLVYYSLTNKGKLFKKQSCNFLNLYASGDKILKEDLKRLNKLLKKYRIK